MADVVLDLNDLRPFWARPDWVVDEIRAALPPGWTLAVLDTPTEGTGDGTTRAHPAALEAVRDARVYMGFGIAEEVLQAGPALGWVHTGSAGVRSSISPTLRRRELVFTNSAGIHAEPMADHVLGMILYFTRGFDFAVRNQARARWDTDPFYAATSPVRELSTLTVGIIGLGGIGRAVAERCRCLRARVIGLRRTARAGGPEGVEVEVGEPGLQRLLAESDVVVVTAPETPETRGMIDQEAFERMKEGALFINVARGNLVVEEALVAALASGRLRGAGLDVTSPEPLPAASPLWRLDNVLITPHVSPVTDRFWRRETDLILENLECFATGRIEAMRNRVDLDAGY